jgi:uroporphyrinogen-III synthase
MTMRLTLLRPEPGNAASAARAEAAGFRVRRCPLFRIEPLDWSLPADARAHDALLLTSANAVRMAGAGLASLAGWPVVAVGAATARAAGAAGLDVVRIGNAGVEALLHDEPRRLLHLCAREASPLPDGARVTAIPVYHAPPIDPAPHLGPDDAMLALHSARAARAAAVLVKPEDRTRLRLAAISEPVLAAAGPGWGASGHAARPDDGALLALAARLWQEARP